MTEKNESFDLLAQEGNDDRNGRPYKQHATLRIYHDELNPDQITDLLGVGPTKTQRKGEPFPHRPQYIAPIGGWFLDSADHVDSVEISVHIEWLLKQLNLSKLHKLHLNGYRVEIVCGIFTNSDNTGLKLTGTIMKEMSEAGLDCWFDVYFIP